MTRDDWQQTLLWEPGRNIWKGTRDRICLAPCVPPHLLLCTFTILEKRNLCSSCSCTTPQKACFILPQLVLTCLIVLSLSTINSAGNGGRVYAIRYSPGWETFWKAVWLVWASLGAQTAENLPALRETWIRSLGWEDPLEKGMATCSSILAWRIPWTEKPGGL